MRRAGGAIAAVMVASSLAAGCAARPSSPAAGGQAELDRIAAQEVVDDLGRGRRTAADVRSRLGTPVVVRFDSGYEVWVYRLEAVGAKQKADGSDRGARHADAAEELVILVAPSGAVVKARTRLAPGRGIERGSAAD